MEESRQLEYKETIGSNTFFENVVLTPITEEEEFFLEFRMMVRYLVFRIR